MPKNLSAKYLKHYQLKIIKKIKKDYKKMLMKDIKIFLKKKKKKKQQYGRECYKNLSEDEKQKLVEYRKKFYGMRNKMCFFIRESIRNFFLLHLYLKFSHSKQKM